MLLREGISWNDLKELRDDEVFVISGIIEEMNKIRQEIAASQG